MQTQSSYRFEYLILIFVSVISLFLLDTKKVYSQQLLIPEIHYVTIDAVIADSSVNIIEVRLKNTTAKAVLVRMRVDTKAYSLLRSSLIPEQQGIASWHFDETEKRLVILTKKENVKGPIQIVVAVSSLLQNNQIECVGFSPALSENNLLKKIKVAVRRGDLEQ